MERTKRARAHLGDRRSHPLATATVRAFGFSLLLGSLFLFFLTLLLYRTQDPARLSLPAAIAASLLLAFLGGGRAAALHRKSGALCGLATGGLLAFLFLLVALCLKGGSLPMHAIPLYLGMPAAGLIGGVLRLRKRRGHRH